MAAAATNRRDVINLSLLADRPAGALRTGEVISSAAILGVKFFPRAI
jgi:hypothetical protein